MQMEMFMRASGKKTKPTESAGIPMQMVLFMRENGSWINKKERELNIGPMEPIMKACLRTVRKKGMENLASLMDLSTMENSIKMRSVEWALTNGVTGRHILDNGHATK
jgi:hypothetical protein